MYAAKAITNKETSWLIHSFFQLTLNDGIEKRNMVGDLRELQPFLVMKMLSGHENM